MSLRFFDLGLAVRTDEPEIAEFTRRLFSRFVDASRAPQGVLEVFREGDAGWRVRDATIDSVVERRAWLPGIVAARLLETVGNETEDHDLFHGAALAHENRGLILSGESGFGKSTVTLALLRRGWRFLSDEVAVLTHDPEPRLVPFPKAIEVRPETAAVVGLELPGVPLRRGKALHDSEALFPGSLSGACAPTAVVFLEGGDVSRPPAEPGLLRVVVHRREDAALADVETMDGAVAADWDGETDGCPVLRIRYEPDRFAAWRLDEVLGRVGVLVVDSSAEQTPPASFDGAPRLASMRAHEGVARLLARFRGRRTLARRLDARGGEFGEFFAAMLGRLAGVRFFRLEVGQLEPMVSLIEGVS